MKKPSQFDKFDRDISKVNDLRYQLSQAYRQLRNGFLVEFPEKKFKDDAQWQDKIEIINQMYKTVIHEELVRQVTDKPYSQRKPQGIYLSNKLCIVCHLPLGGKQEKYCSDPCRIIAKSRKYRSCNPEGKAQANLKYLQDIYPAETSKNKGNGK